MFFQAFIQTNQGRSPNTHLIPEINKFSSYLDTFLACQSNFFSILILASSLRYSAGDLKSTIPVVPADLERPYRSSFMSVCFLKSVYSMPPSEISAALMSLENVSWILQIKKLRVY